MAKAKNRGRRSCSKRTNTKRIVRPGYIDLIVDYSLDGNLIITFIYVTPKYKGGHHTDGDNCGWCNMRTNPHNQGRVRNLGQDYVFGHL